MARADLLISIVRAARGGDEAALQRTVEALIAEERQKQHHVLADRLEELLHQNGSRSLKDVPAPGSGLSLSVPRRTLDELFLPADVEQACREVVAEQAQVELLRSYGLEPRHRLLLTGPPGNGKTSLAEAMAEALVVPLLQVRYEAVIGSYLGETAARIADLFAYARTRQCVLFFDEFDAIAKERGDVHETGEIKRVVSSLLMQVDTLPSHAVIVAASNHPELLDRAVGRRFEVHMTLPPPTAAARRRWFERFFAEPLPQGQRAISAKTLADKTAGASFSQLEDLTLDIRRQHVLRPEVSLRSLITERLSRWQRDTGIRARA